MAGGLQPVREGPSQRWSATLKHDGPNDGEQAADLTGFSVASVDGRSEFAFPPNYMLLPGDEVTVWCAPSRIDLDVDNVLPPYLFWTNADGSLRAEPFFVPGRPSEALLLDPLKVEVASLRVAEDGDRKEFRVLHCVSEHPRAISSRIDTRFCAGCLSPPEFQVRAPYPSPDSGKVRGNRGGRDVYIFSRYWGVASHKSLLEHFLSILLVPLLESFRALLIVVLLADRVRTGCSPDALRLKTTAVLLLMLATDLMARRLSLCIKSGLLVSIASFSSFVLDQLATMATYAALECAYPVLAPSFSNLLRAELMIALLDAVAEHRRFLQARASWHPLFKQLVQLEYRFRTLFCACGIARQLLLLLLLLLPPLRLAETELTSALAAVSLLSSSRLMALVLVPLATIAMGIDVVRAAAIVLHLLSSPFRSKPFASGDEQQAASTPKPTPPSFRTPKRLVNPMTPMTRGIR